jgi:steroid 5-alpha reductase family enzyme
MSVGLQLAVLGLAMFALMSAGWAWQRRYRNAGIVDVIWSAGMGLGALWCALTGSGAVAPRALLALLGGIWSARLALHIGARLRTEEEDGRYRYLREHWQNHQGKFYGFFLFQAALVLLFSLPFVAVARARTNAPLPLLLGGLIWVIAVAGEAIADRQLARFRAYPAHRGRTCREGLWGRSRHPNYFFEWLHWFAYVALAWSSPLWWLSLGGPLVMGVFLRWISGIPFTEAQALRSRGEDYRAYQRDTPMLFPRLSKPKMPRSENEYRH